MSDIVEVIPLNEAYVKIKGDVGLREELSEFFSFRVKGYQFMPAYKRGWDGYLRLYNKFSQTLYKGLVPYVQRFCDDRGYNLINPLSEDTFELEDDYVEKLAKASKFPFEPYWYQTKYVRHCIENNRSLILSPTSSGKSAMIYLLHRHYYDVENERMLIIVPTTGLVAQMAGDFRDYGYDPKKIHMIKSGAEKDVDAPVTISTWQSIYKMPPEWFSRFGAVIVDEAHTATAKSLTGIMESMTDCRYRFGFTGTIDEESKTAKLTLEGLFGPVKKFVDTKTMIDEGKAATTKVVGFVLDHSKETKAEFGEKIKELKKAKKEGANISATAIYAAEVEFMMDLPIRNRFITNLVKSLKGNNLILVTRREHGLTLQKMLEREGRIVHFIDGKTSADKREELRKIVENDPEKRHDIVATFGVFSTGVSIKRLDNLVFAMALKSLIKTVQSIGRMLRLGNGSDDTTIYDVGDKFVSSGAPNYTLGHFDERLEIYRKERHKVKIRVLKV